MYFDCQEMANEEDFANQEMETYAFDNTKHTEQSKECSLPKCQED